MCDLFLAGFNRLWRSRVFQICCLVSFAANVFVMLATYRQVLNYTELGLEHSIALDSVFYGLVPVLGVMCAAFVSLFIGTEHSDGVMRNMLVVGRARWEIYLANYAVCFVGTTAYRMQGVIGVVGPTRMDYAKITARLSYLAEGLSRLFGRGELPGGTDDKK